MPNWYFAFVPNALLENCAHGKKELSFTPSQKINGVVRYSSRFVVVCPQSHFYFVVKSAWRISNEQPGRDHPHIKNHVAMKN